MRLYRCFAWDERARTRSRGGPLWFPRELQGGGRHDNPEVFGCLYVTALEHSAVVELLADLRGSRFGAWMLRRNGLPLGLAEIDLDDARPVVDLDEPRVLVSEALRPSEVATTKRAVTQPQALELHARHPEAAALRWWSSHEASWINYTIFDRARTSLRLHSVRSLTPDDDAVLAATDFLGMAD